MPKTSKFIFVSIAHKRAANAEDFTEHALIDMGRSDGELARHFIAEAKRLGASNLPREAVALQMGTWLYEALGTQATVDQLSVMLPDLARLPVATSIHSVEATFREPPAA